MSGTGGFAHFMYSLRHSLAQRVFIKHVLRTHIMPRADNIMAH